MGSDTRDARYRRPKEINVGEGNDDGLIAIDSVRGLR